MIAALLLGRKGSIGFPGKNLFPVLGRPLAWYPMNAARKAELIDKRFISTDDERLMDLARENDFEVIIRPPYLCSAQALGEDAYVHGYREIIKRTGQKPELMVLLFCNAVTLLTETIDEGIRILLQNPEYDSAVTVSCYNHWNPIRARKIGPDGLLYPFISDETFLDSKSAPAGNDFPEEVWFADVAVSVVRSDNLEHIEDGLLPQKWMGRKIYPLKQEAGFDMDFEWQIPQAEWWLRRYGFNDPSD